MYMERKTLGIIGGMGPAATVDMLDKIVRYTDAASDREHIRVYVDVNTTIADRTASIKGTGPSCLPAICESAKKLADMGADYLILSCNTAHYYLDEIRATIDRPILSIVDAVTEYVTDHGINTVALLATEGTMLGRVYTDTLEHAGVKVVLPTEEEQKVAMKAIYDVKEMGAERTDTTALNDVVRHFGEQGAKTVILACTEFPLIVDKMTDVVTYLDATEILVRKAIRTAGYNTK